MLKWPPAAAALPHKADRPHWRHLTEFEEPPLSVGVEEGVCQVIAIVLWDLEGLIFNAFIQILELQKQQ